jgi:hypothetical protein
VASLAGILNLVARAAAGTDPIGAAVLRGAARHLATMVTPTLPGAITPAAGDGPAGGASPGASLVTQLRRDATAMLRESLGPERLTGLRAEGEAMDEDRAVAYALEMIATAQRSNAGA